MQRRDTAESMREVNALINMPGVSAKLKKQAEEAIQKLLARRLKEITDSEDRAEETKVRALEEEDARLTRQKAVTDACSHMQRGPHGNMVSALFGGFIEGQFLFLVCKLRDCHARFSYPKQPGDEDIPRNLLPDNLEGIGGAFGPQMNLQLLKSKILDDEPISDQSQDAQPQEAA